jgi:hypothetical protein
MTFNLRLPLRASQSPPENCAGPGRPRALDDAKRREVCALVTAGCGLDDAARYVGCKAITIRREATRNAVFREQLRHAELEAQRTPLETLRKAADTHWRAAAWYLERTQPSRFARLNGQRFTTEQVIELMREFMDVILSEIDDDDTLERALRRIRAFVKDTRLENRAIVALRQDVHSRRRQMIERQAEWQADDAAAPRSEPELNDGCSLSTDTADHRQLITGDERSTTGP